MGKYFTDLDSDLVKMVETEVDNRNLQNYGVTVRPIGIRKCNTYGEVVKGNGLVEALIGEQDIVCVALYEELFDMVDDATKRLWIESLISRIYYNCEKDKLEIIKPEINVGLGMYDKYKNVAVDAEVLALTTIAQIKEKAKRLKEERAAAKREKRKN